MTSEELDDIRAKALRTLHEIAADESQPDEARVLAAAALLQHFRPPPAASRHQCEFCS